MVREVVMLEGVYSLVSYCLRGYLLYSTSILSWDRSSAIQVSYLKIKFLSPSYLPHTTTTTTTTTTNNTLPILQHLL